MFDRFIVATDLSPASHAVVGCIGGLRQWGAKECLLLQCLSVLESSSLAWVSKMDFLESGLAEQKRILEELGFVTTARLVPGFAKTEINRVAEEEEYSLIVVGSRGYGLVAQPILGGVADAVMNYAKKPLLVVRVEMSMGQGVCVQGTRCDFLEHILFPTDFSESADQAFRYLEEIVSGGAKHVTLLHVQDKTRIEPYLRNRLEEFNDIDRGRLEAMKGALEKRGNVEVKIELAYGAPVSEILRVIRERDLRLVVMGSQGRGFISEIFLGSVSHGVARLSNASVLFIPANR